jgi:hypothetical protein
MHTVLQLDGMSTYVNYGKVTDSVIQVFYTLSVFLPVIITTERRILKSSDYLVPCPFLPKVSGFASHISKLCP